MYFVYNGSCIQYLKGLKQDVLEEIPFLTELLSDLTIEVYIFTFHHIHYKCEPDFSYLAVKEQDLPQPWNCNIQKVQERSLLN
jgi:hypothetical protein